MSRGLRYALVGCALVAFAVVSAGLARVLAAASAERHAVVEIVKAQAGGDGPAVVARIEGCAGRPACRSAVMANVARLHAPGEVRVLRLDPPPALAVATRVATARIAWRAGTELPVVQCVTLRRRGDVVRGFRVAILAFGPPIGRERSCPKA